MLFQSFQQVLQIIKGSGVFSIGEMFYNFATNFVQFQGLQPFEVNITNDINYYIRKLGNGTYKRDRWGTTNWAYEWKK